MHNEHRSISLRASWLPLSALSAVFLVEMLDNSILTVALPTIGRDLAASATALQWVTGSYAVLFGGLMLLFGSLADRFGRRRMMLIGLALLATASAATVLVSTAEQLIALRGLMGIAAAMTTPGSMALAYRLFDEEAARVRAVTVISTVGLIGLAVGPTMGGLVLGVAPWQVLLLVNVPIALYALVGIRAGIGQDAPETLHRAPLDVVGALLATAAIVLALLAPTGFVEVGPRSALPWGLLGGALAAAGLFWIQERRASHPLIDLALLGSPLVASGLAFKAAAGLATAGLSYLVTLQLQFAWGWPPALAAVGMLPQVVVLLALGPFVNPLVARWGMARAAWGERLGRGAGPGSVHRPQPRRLRRRRGGARPRRRRAARHRCRGGDHRPRRAARRKDVGRRGLDRHRHGGGQRGRSGRRRDADRRVRRREHRGARVDAPAGGAVRGRRHLGRGCADGAGGRARRLRLRTLMPAREPRWGAVTARLRRSGAARGRRRSRTQGGGTCVSADRSGRHETVSRDAVAATRRSASERNPSTAAADSGPN